MSELASYAAYPGYSKGRFYDEPAPQHRSDYQRDRDRVIHSTAFRRLEYKTQVFVNHEGDLFRTRLTHSVEVAQIGRTIARALNLDEDLTEAICLAHDLGHTPFGHAGQEALNQCMADYEGFEHNLQSLRVVDLLEEKYADFPGLNLTFETREGILKHCSVKKARELGELGQRFINKTHPTLEGQIANVADEIAYNNHDVDDGLRYGFITLSELRRTELFGRQYDKVKKRYRALPEKRLIPEVIRRMINIMVVDLINNSQHLLDEYRIKTLDDVREAPGTIIRQSAAMQANILELKQFLRTKLYHHFRVRRMTRKAYRVIAELFEAFAGDPLLLPPDYSEKLQAQESDTEKMRVIADYIAGMTDRYAITEYTRLFVPGELS